MRHSLGTVLRMGRAIGLVPNHVLPALDWNEPLPPGTGPTEAWLAALLASPVPRAVVVSQAHPVDRYWPPAPARVRNGIGFASRHPELHAEFPDVDPYRIGRAHVSHADGRDGDMWSMKGGIGLRPTSSHEMRHLIRMEVDPAVRWFVDQPVKLRYWNGDRMATYRPDALAFMRDGEMQFREFKPERFARAPENLKRFQSIGEALAGMGYGFRVLTDEHLKVEPQRSNYDRIWRDRMADVPERPVLDAIRGMLLSRTEIPVREVLDRQPTLRRKHVNMLVRRGFLRYVDLNAPLSLDSAVALGPGLMPDVDGRGR